MKVSTTIMYKHSVLAPKGFIFDETKLDEIETKIFGESVTLSLGGNVLRYSEMHHNTMPEDNNCNWEAFMDEHLTPYLLPINDGETK